jgi:tetratricopeptide (TPR) repeat protein
MAASDFNAAANAFSRLLAVRPNLPQLRERLAEIYVRTDQNGKAVELYRELIKREPTRYEYYNVLGELYEQLHKLDDAINYIEQSLKLNADQPESYFLLSDLYRQAKQTDKMTATMTTWKKKFPLDWRVPYFTALVHMDRKEFATAITDYSEAERLAHESPDEVKLRPSFYFGYASAYERAGEIPKAAALLQKCIELDPQFSNAYNYLGYMWADKGTNLTQALELIQKAVTMEPDNGAYLDSLGWVLHRLNRSEEALPHLRRAVELLEKDTKRSKEDRLEDAVVYDHLADVLMKLGKTAEAIQTWKRAVAIDPGNKEIAGKLEKYRATSP